METQEQSFSEQDFLAFLEERRGYNLLREYKMFNRLRRDSGYWTLFSGMRHLYCGHLDIAMRFLRAACDLLPLSPSAWLFYAECCVEQRLYTKAWNAVVSVRNMVKQELPPVLFERFWLTVWTCLQQLDRVDEEMGLLEDISTDESFSNSLRVEALLRLGQIFESLDFNDEALSCYLQALEMPEGYGNVTLWECVGQLFMENQDWDAALSAFQSALNLHPSEKIFLGAACACEHLDDAAGAYWYWSRAHRLDPHNERVVRLCRNARIRMQQTQHWFHRWQTQICAWWSGSLASASLAWVCLFILAGTLLSFFLFQEQVLSQSLLPILFASWPVSYVCCLVIGCLRADPHLHVLVRIQTQPGISWQPMWRGFPLFFRRIIFISLGGFGFFFGFFWIAIGLSATFPSAGPLALQSLDGIWSVLFWHLMVLLFIGPVYWLAKREITAVRFPGRSSSR